MSSVGEKAVDTKQKFWQRFLEWWSVKRVALISPKVNTKMRGEISLEEMNYQVLALGRALFGSISPNCRMIMLEYDNGLWRIDFILEKDNNLPERVLIEDIQDEFFALQETNINCKTRIEINDGKIPWPTESLTKRVVYRRMELEWRDGDWWPI